MKVNLENISFGSDIEEDLKKEIKEDISNFDLNLSDDKISAHLYLKDKKNVLLTCEGLMEFEYPEKSKEQKVKASHSSIGNYRSIDITFSYNNKIYSIMSLV